MNEDMKSSSSNNNSTNEKSNANSSIRNSQTSFDRHHRQSNSFNLFANSPSASTPLSLCDPNDELWFQFLSSLQEPAPLDGQTSINSNTSFNSRKDVTNPDDDDDPDFTVCLENVDVDDRDFLDDWFQVPKKEAVALVKDAIEFCDGVPIVYEDYRSKSKLKPNRKSHENEANTSTKLSDQSSINSSLNLNINDSSSTTTNEEKSITDDDDEPKKEQNNQSKNVKEFENKKSSNNNSQLVENENDNEFVPQFTDFQRKQLDEQLRNHTQLLTQTCLVTYCSSEYKSIFLEAFNLLNVLKRLTKLKPTDSANQNNEEITNEEEEAQCQLFSNEFQIINLKDAINIIESLEKMPNEHLKSDLKQGVPSKILELVVNSPVFYNTNLIPNLKYKYQSHFKRSLFSDIEKILLIMGFNQFKHLPKAECCQCIKDHLLPHRSIDDIRKQLCNISNSEQRQIHLKELLKKQQQTNSENYEFDVKRHYKSPLEQSDNVQLPSMYTMIVERLKMANILKDTKKHLQEKRERELNNSFRSEPEFTPSKSDTNSKKKASEVSLFENRSETPKKRFRTCSVSSVSSSPSHFNASIDCSARNYNASSINDENQKSQTKRSEIESSIKISRVIKEVQNDKNIDAFAKKNNVSQNKPVLMNNPTSTPIMLNSLSSLSDLISLSKVAETPANHQSPIIAFSSIDFNQTAATNGTIASAPPQSTSMKQPTQAPIVIPPNFNGTILIQPTIHIHTGSHTNFSKIEGKFRQIQPKNPRR